MQCTFCSPANIYLLEAYNCNKQKKFISFVTIQRCYNDLNIMKIILCQQFSFFSKIVHKARKKLALISFDFLAQENGLDN